MDLSFMNWFENELASEFRSKKAVKSILVDKLINDTQLRFTLDLQELDFVSEVIHRIPFRSTIIFLSN